MDENTIEELKEMIERLKNSIVKLDNIEKDFDEIANTERIEVYHSNFRDLRNSLKYNLENLRSRLAIARGEW